MPKQSPRKNVAAAMLCLVITVTIGCQKEDPVTGRVVWADRTPASELAGATIELQSITEDGTSSEIANLISCVGIVQEDGGFAIRTVGSDVRPPAGRYRGLIVAPKWSPSTIERQVELDRTITPILDPKFETFERSGIELVIQPAGGFHIVQVERAK